MPKGALAEIKLDDDIADRLDRLRREGTASLEEVVNQVLRSGLDRLEAPSRPAEQPFHTTTVSLGRCRLADLNNIAEALTVAEGEHFG
jgi:hypothetical protein